MRKKGWAGAGLRGPKAEKRIYFLELRPIVVRIAKSSPASSASFYISADAPNPAASTAPGSTKFPLPPFQRGSLYGQNQPAIRPDSPLGSLPRSMCLISAVAYQSLHPDTLSGNLLKLQSAPIRTFSFCPQVQSSCLFPHFAFRIPLSSFRFLYPIRPILLRRP